MLRMVNFGHLVSIIIIANRTCLVIDQYTMILTSAMEEFYGRNSAIAKATSVNNLLYDINTVNI